MKIPRRRKYVLLGLSVYWPALFILTHIPLPELAQRPGMSDKIMHFLAYLVLTFLWCSVISPREKVNWRGSLVWITMIVISFYGLVDEILQHYVGRIGDLGDFSANILGVLTALLILSFCEFWTSCLIVSGIFIFAVTSLSKIAELYTNIFINAAFQFTAYAVFTLIWLQYMSVYLSGITSRRLLWVVIGLILPLGLLTDVTLFSMIFGKPVYFWDYMTGVFGICSAVAVSFIACQMRKKQTTMPEKMFDIPDAC